MGSAIPLREVPPRELVRLPPPDAVHAHTGCCHLEYHLGGGWVLAVLRAGPPLDLDGGAACESGWQLAGLIETPDSAQQQIESSGLLDDLGVEWSNALGRRWFAVPMQQPVVDAVFQRLSALAKEAE